MPRFSSLLDYYRYQKAKSGLTQEELRRRWGLKRQSHVHMLLYGKCRPRPALAKVIAEDTGLDLLTVLGFYNRSRRPQRETPRTRDRRKGR